MVHKDNQFDKMLLVLICTTQQVTESESLIKVVWNRRSKDFSVRGSWVGLLITVVAFCRLSKLLDLKIPYLCDESGNHPWPHRTIEEQCWCSG